MTQTVLQTYISYLVLGDSSAEEPCQPEILDEPKKHTPSPVVAANGLTIFSNVGG